MSFRVELTRSAARQVEAAAEWWRQNRPTAPALFLTEMLEALELLAERAPMSQVVDEVEGKAVRKVRLPRSGYALYFTFEADLVTVHALWHVARGSGPPLP